MTPESQPMFDTDELVINMGPQHPSTHGVLRVVLRLDGERVVGSEVVIGYLHRGIEKLCENRDYTQVVLITDTFDYRPCCFLGNDEIRRVREMWSVLLNRTEGEHQR